MRNIEMKLTSRLNKWSGLVLMTLLMMGVMSPQAIAEGGGVSAEMFTVNNLWVLIAGCLVFIMHLGFATLESGLTRAKNTVNILF